MKYSFVSILLVIFVTACNPGSGSGIEVIVNNQSDFDIQNIFFFTTEKVDTLSFEKVKTGQTVSDFLSMKENVSDGAYILEFVRLNSQLESLSAGYYTNGYALEDQVSFEIRNDTVLVSFSDK
jgi:hypothetical protein